MMVRGDVKGGQILGSYPDVSETSPMAITKRGLVVPTLPYDAVWNGVAQLMGVKDESRPGCYPPSSKECNIFTDSQLFQSGNTPAYPCPRYETKTKQIVGIRFTTKLDEKEPCMHVVTAESP